MKRMRSPGGEGVATGSRESSGEADAGPSTVPVELSRPYLMGYRDALIGLVSTRNSLSAHNHSQGQSRAFVITNLQRGYASLRRIPAILLRLA